MFCPECTVEYRAGFTRCSDCDVELVNHRPTPRPQALDRPSDRLLVFFLLTYAVTWILVSAPLSDGANRYLPWALRTLLSLIGIFGPSLVAVGLTIHDEGAGGVRALLRRLIDWRVDGRWYLFALFYMAPIVLLVTLVSRLVSGTWPRSSTTPLVVTAMSIVIQIPILASEEIGWRGYALPQLTARFGLQRASLILGPLWAVWHLPLFFVQEASHYSRSVPVYLVEVTAISVAFAWLYTNTRGSLLLATLMHLAIDQTFAAFPAPAADPNANPFSFDADPAQWFGLACLCLVAVYFLFRMPDGNATAK